MKTIKKIIYILISLFASLIALLLVNELVLNKNVNLSSLQITTESEKIDAFISNYYYKKYKFLSR